MEIHWTESKISLERAEDFRAFKLVVRDGGLLWQNVVDAFAGLARFDGVDTAWVSQAGLIGLAGVAASPSWLDDFQTMVAKARPFGWIDDASGDIKAHVERR